MHARRALWGVGATATAVFLVLFLGRPLVGTDEASAAALSGTGRSSVNVYVGPSGAPLAGTVLDGGGLVPSATYAGPWESSGACVVCGTPGDGGVLSTSVGQRYVLRVVDQNGSPATATENGPCVAYGSAGLTIPANSAVPYAGPASSADGGTPYLTCCAQTSTESPSGPRLCANPLQ